MLVAPSLPTPNLWANDFSELKRGLTRACWVSALNFEFFATAWFFVTEVVFYWPMRIGL
jgi:hypothetical protein